jgi:hypothetical protein
MGWLRTGLPLAIIAAGLISIVATGGKEWSFEGGLLLISAGLSVWLLNFFFRVGAKGDLERDEEDRAREFYSEHGYWPDEEPERGSGPERPPDPHGRPTRPEDHGPKAHRRPDGPVRRGHRRGT